MRLRLTDKPVDKFEFIPYYEGFKGTVSKIDDEPKKYLIKGLYEKIDDNKILIKELPIGTWTMTYISFLEGLVDGVSKNGKKQPSEIRDFVSLSTEINVQIEVTFPRGKLATLESTIEANGINGVEKLYSVDHEIVPDRIEAGSFAIASSMTKGNIEITHIRPEDLEVFLEALKFTGSEIKIDKNSIKIMSSKRPEPYDIVTQTHPGFPTDLQAQYMALMSISNGNSSIKENIFENRFMHVPELLRMGANISINNQTASIIGVKQLKGSKVMASDLRASMSLILGALAASGSSEIDGIYHLDRGYEKIEDKLSNLGAIIRRSK